MTQQSGSANPPPQIRRPNKLSADKELDSYFRQIEWLLFQLWNRTGGGDDVVDSTINSQVDTDGLFGLFSRISNIEYRNVESTSVNYTTIGSDIVLCNAAITVTLNDEPDDQEIVDIKRKSGLVVVDGNGKLIDGVTSWNINVINSSMKIIYTADTDDWSVI